MDSLLVLNLVDEGSNVRKQLDGKLIASFDELLGVLGCANARRGTGQNDSTGGQSSALRKEAYQLGDTEDEITAKVRCQLSSYGPQRRETYVTYVRGQSCMTRPLLRPRM
jgi:hypothetical protein